MTINPERYFLDTNYKKTQNCYMNIMNTKYMAVISIKKTFVIAMEDSVYNGSFLWSYHGIPYHGIPRYTCMVHLHGIPMVYHGIPAYYHSRYCIMYTTVIVWEHTMVNLGYYHDIYFTTTVVVWVHTMVGMVYHALKQCTIMMLWYIMVNMAFTTIYHSKCLWSYHGRCVVL